MKVISRGDGAGPLAVMKPAAFEYVVANSIEQAVAALAQAGEVLVSSTVRDLMAGSGITFTDRGTHILRGIPGEWRLFTPDLPTARAPTS